MNRKHIPAFALRIGQRAYIEPARAGLPRGPKLEGAIVAGEMEVTRWVFDLVRRGQAVAWSGPPEDLEGDALAAHQEDILKRNADAENEAQFALEETTETAIAEALRVLKVSHV